MTEPQSLDTTSREEQSAKNMRSKPAPDIDRRAIAEAAQRAAEQAALKKVRKAIDQAQDAQNREKKTLRRALALSAMLVAFALALLFALILAGPSREKGPVQLGPVQLPGNAVNLQGKS